jgi:light-harvesting complex I chlorophyll a/b binding protein 1
MFRGCILIEFGKIMLQLVLLSSILVVSAAFAPIVSRGSSARSMSMMAERSKSMPFLSQPVKLDGTLAGDEGFDPLGLSSIEDLGIDLYWMREAELKHARVAMLAITGSVLQEAGFVVPGAPTSPNQIDNLWTCVDQNPGPIFASIIFIGIVELFSGFAITEGRKSGDRAPGDFGLDYFNFSNTDAAASAYALKEIRNGRLAMWAAAGMLVQGGLTPGQGALSNLFGLTLGN